MLSLQGVSYSHPNKDLLFQDIHFVIHRQDKVALIGNNGTGKSTLLRVMAGELQPAGGQVMVNGHPYYVPQLTAQYRRLSVAQALRIDGKLQALHAILAGDVSENNMTILDEDWGIEERCKEAFAHWGLNGAGLYQSMSMLSGGQRTKVFLAGILIHRPDIVLLDEPSNHLDQQSRDILYDYIRTTHDTLVVVSHDRVLLDLLPIVCELSAKGITVYGGNYTFYIAQKQLEQAALDQDVKSKEKALRKARETERQAVERQQKLDARGKRKQEKEGLPTISMNTFRNNAEKSTARMKGVHEEKVGGLSQELQELRAALPGADKMKMDLDHSGLHKGKVLITGRGVNGGYGPGEGWGMVGGRGVDRGCRVDGEDARHSLWQHGLDIQILSGERIAIKGLNGSGKTTLIKILLGELSPATGTIEKADGIRSIYIDQDYTLIDDNLTVYEQAQLANDGALEEHEIKTRLNRYLFTSEYWGKPCSTLSGGEKMRLMLCYLTIGNKAPDIIVLDEPTNNLDIQNIGILTAAIESYQGTLLVVSHDVKFAEDIRLERTIMLG